MLHKMRTLIIPLILATLPAMAVKPDKLFVIVHTSNRVIDDYTCSSAFSESDPNALIFKSVLKSPGSSAWHATGGTAPYTLIRDMDGCITVRDAAGTTATGCGTIKEVHVRLSVDCGTLSDSTSYMKYRPINKVKDPHIPVAAPPRGHTPLKPNIPGKVPPPPPPPTHGPGTNPKMPDHLQPVSGPEPGVHHLPPPAPPINTPSQPPIHQRSAPAPGPTSHGTTTTYHVNSSAGRSTMYHNTSHSYSSGTSGGVTRSSPVPH